MKIFRCAVTALAIAFFAMTIHAQPAIDIREGNADYPIPMPSAQIAVGSERGPLFMEPSTVRNAAFAAQNIWSNGAPRLSMGAEFAPLLIGDAVDLSEYLSGRLIRVLLRTRISVAAETNNNGAMRAALGVRWMLHDDADLRADSLFQRMLLRWANEQRKPNIDSLRSAMKEVLWNRSVVEIAFGAVYRSARNSGGEIAFAVSRYNGFLSAGFPLPGTSGQIQFGASGWTGFAESDTRYQRQGSLTLRSFYGSASERLFAGARLVAANIVTPDYRLELGGLLRIGNGFWLRPDIGVSLMKHSFQGAEAGVTLSFGTPELH